MRAGGTVAAAAGVALLLTGCGADPVLLDRADFPGATSVKQDAWGGSTPGATWCSGLGSAQYAAGGEVSSWLSFGDHGDAGATLIDRSADRASAEHLAGMIAEQATVCAESDAATTGGASIEPLDGLDDGERGWTTRTPDGEWGQYALVPLDDWRLLAVGFSTTDDEAPVELTDLIDRAREGAEQFPPEQP